MRCKWLLICIHNIYTHIFSSLVNLFLSYSTHVACRKIHIGSSWSWTPFLVLTSSGIPLDHQVPCKQRCKASNNHFRTCTTLLTTYKGARLSHHLTRDLLNHFSVSGHCFNGWIISVGILITPYLNSETDYLTMITLGLCVGVLSGLAF